MIGNVNQKNNFVKEKVIFLKSNWKTRSILSTGDYTKIEDTESNISFF